MNGKQKPVDKRWSMWIKRADRISSTLRATRHWQNRHGARAHTRPRPSEIDAPQIQSPQRQVFHEWNTRCREFVLPKFGSDLAVAPSTHRMPFCARSHFHYETSTIIVCWASKNRVIQKVFFRGGATLLSSFVCVYVRYCIVGFFFARREFVLAIRLSVTVRENEFWPFITWSVVGVSSSTIDGMQYSKIQR